MFYLDIRQLLKRAYRYLSFRETLRLKLDSIITIHANAYPFPLIVEINDKG